ncbi:MAG: Cobalamin import system permease protein BtuC [Methanoregula sp. PtaU1.Bin006]|uniref:FecCD family ABC transporter permease n=1 Tax=Methanoregula sp. PtaU1.Bin006 TaxID=1811681 RepID=UPI0009D1A434|nr:iron ABC transporter permease [Methanoregula sp. PtaU1.Bin006]OPY32823.1 MAG: Cobalamin import system permease protein BtuC [Methanoregula sp. PtaU1.Bin006]
MKTNQGTQEFWGKKNYPLFTVVLFLLLATTTLVSLMVGRFEVPPLDVISAILSSFMPRPDLSPTIRSVIVDVRLPRVIAVILVGAALSVAGTAFQGLFRNPLVSPDILGVSAGAGFGAAIALLLTENIVATQTLAFITGIIAVGLAYGISRVYKINNTITLVLAGIVVGALFQALTSLVKYVADPLNKLPAIVFWLMGSFNHVSAQDLVVAAPILLSGMAVLYLIRWRINLLSMGEEDAKALGVNIEHLKITIIVSATVISAAAVSICGIVGWIGLVIPHAGRIFVGPDHKLLVPVAALIGASYLLIVDTVARTVTMTEIPIGIITALIGAPVFAYLLMKTQAGWR